MTQSDSTEKRLRCCGVVLAGGQSSRMGQDKASLPLPDGQTFLEQAQTLLGSLPLDQVLISGARPGGVPDPVAGLGPLGGLYGIACATDAQSLLVIPVDMPQLRTAQLELLLQAGNRSGRACYFGNFYLPLWLPLNQSVRDFLQRAVEGRGPDSIRALLAAAGAESLAQEACEQDFGQAFGNINTPSEYTQSFGRPLPVADK